MHEAHEYYQYSCSVTYQVWYSSNNKLYHSNYLSKRDHVEVGSKSTTTDTCMSSSETYTVRSGLVLIVWF